MLYRFVLSFLLLFLLFPIYAQYNMPQNKIWIFGFQAGLDFNGNVPVPITSAMNSGNLAGTLEANTSVCDSAGTLLFYTDGTSVWNRFGTVMPNGVNLTGLGGGPTDNATNSTSQGALIVPMPDSAGKYYIFSLTAVDQPANKRGKLFYSIVNMSLAGGNGDVVAAQKSIPVDSGLTEKMIGIVGDRCNIWVLTCVRNQAVYKAYEITAAGLNPVPVISNTGTPKNLSFGCLAVSPDRKLVACSEQAIFGGNNGLELSQFDAATGQVYNAIQMEPLLGYYGVCFSPDNTKLYGSSFTSVFQFDVTAANPASTKTLITGNGRNTDLQLGPDSRIYFHHSATDGNSLSYIRFPNATGTACQPVLDTLHLPAGSTFSFGLHNQVPVMKRDTLASVQSVSAACFASQQQLAAADINGWDYTWNTGANSSGITVTSPGTYWLQYYTGPCRYHTDTFEVGFPGGILPQINTQSSCNAMANGKAWASTYTGDTVTYHYQWYNTAGDTLSLTDTLFNAPAGQYSLSISTANCDTVLTFSISEEMHRVSFLADTLICLGTPITFQNTSDPAITSFRWYFGDGDSSLSATPVYLYATPGNFIAMLTGKNATCTDTAYKNIIVDAPANGYGFALSPHEICMGESVRLETADDSTLSHLQYNWGDQNTLVTEDKIVQHAYDQAGVMPVSLTAVFRVCPEQQYTDTVKVHALPVVYLGPDTSICLHGAPVVLTSRIPRQPGEQYRWSNGAETGTIEVRHEGSYKLTVINEHDCANSDVVEVNKDCYIDIPNAFTPDNDGSNDYFFPRQLLSRSLSGFHMTVFNRWGQVVFETSRGEGRGWDGKWNGKDQPQGVYLYRIEATLDNKERETYQGNVTLIR